MPNYTTNPFFETNVLNTGQYSSAVITQETVVPITGVGSAKVVTPGAVVREGISWLTPSGLGIGYDVPLEARFSAKGTGQIDYWLRLSSTLGIISETTPLTAVLAAAPKDYFIAATSVRSLGGTLTSIDNMELMVRTDDGIAPQAVTYWVDNGLITVASTSVDTPFPVVGHGSSW